MNRPPTRPAIVTLPDGCPDDILHPIVADAAARAGVLAHDIHVLSVTEVQWPDGALGCPQPGMMYTQALVDGYRIMVRAGDQELDYRVSGSGRFRVCGQ